MKVPCSIRLFCFTYPPVNGGSEIEAQRVSCALRALEYKVTVVCGGGPPMPPASHWIDPFGTPVRIVGNSLSERWRPYAYALAVLWELISRFHDYELAYFLMPGLQVLFGVPMARLLGKRVVMKFSGSNEVRRLTHSATGRAELFLLRHLAHRVMILNPGIREEALEAGFRPEQLVWMPNPVDADFFSPCAEREKAGLRRQLGVPLDARIVLFVGRFAPEKELPTLIGAFAQVAASLPQAQLVLAGDGPMRPDLEALVKSRGLVSRVIFTGRLSVESVRDWMRAADAFTLVSSLEGFPVALIESMAAGLAPVVTDIPANLQIVEDRRNGLVASLRNEESIAHAILDLLNSPAQCASLATEGRKMISLKYSNAEIMGHYEAMFRSLP